METTSCILMSSMFNSVCELRKLLRQKEYSFPPAVLRMRFHTQYALYTVSRSESPRRKESRARSFCELEPMVLTNGDFDERMAAMLSDASRHLKNAPCTINFPRKTSRGSLASCEPNGVRFSPLVNAFTSFSASIARRMFFDDGGSRASRSVCSTSPSLQILTRRTRSWRDSRSISGVCCSGSCGG